MAALPRCRRWPYIHVPDWQKHEGVDVCTCKRCLIFMGVSVPPRNFDALQNSAVRQIDPDFPGCTT